jgi:hypothetical protein
MVARIYRKPSKMAIRKTRRHVRNDKRSFLSGM